MAALSRPAISSWQPLGAIRDKIYKKGGSCELSELKKTNRVRIKTNAQWTHTYTIRFTHICTTRRIDVVVRFRIFKIKFPDLSDLECEPHKNSKRSFRYREVWELKIILYNNVWMWVFRRRRTGNQLSLLRYSEI